jgi:hypothetical protein
VKRHLVPADDSTMTLSLSPLVRLVALIGLLVATMFAAFLFFTTRNADDVPVAEPVPVRPQATPSPAEADAATPATPQAKAEPAPAPEPLIADNGLPTRLMTLLETNRVVVVSLFVADAPLDLSARLEAKSGAAQAGVAFTGFNVLNEQIGQALAKKLGAVETPAVLVVRRPDEVVAHFEGFVDSKIVEQAAADARR